MTAQSEMAIPKSRSDTISQIALIVIVVFFTMLGIYSLLKDVAIIASIIWLAIVAYGVWAAGKEEGGFRRFFINRLGLFSTRLFVECVPQDNGPAEIRFGYRLCGCRLFYLSVPIDKIETVEWHAGRATSMTGRDMNDWHVALWFDHDDPIKSKKRQKWRKPAQDVYIVGPSGRREDTEPFGFAFLDFLRVAGASLLQGQDNSTFVRKAARAETNGEHPTNASTPANESAAGGSL